MDIYEYGYKTSVLYFIFKIILHLLLHINPVIHTSFTLFAMDVKLYAGKTVRPVPAQPAEILYYSSANPHKILNFSTNNPCIMYLLF